MAITTQGVFEIRTTGSDANGGVFDVGVTGHGTDYSQQNAAQLTVADVVTNSTTTVTSATGGFTAAMIGNGINIAGTIYVITAVATTNSITVDRATGTGTAQAASVGGALASPGYWSGQCVANNTAWIMAGTYTISSSTSKVSGGLVVSPNYACTLIGYKATRGDAPLPGSGNQPLITSTLTGSIFLVTIMLGTLKNVAVTGTSNLVQQCACYECTFTCNSVTVSQYGLTNGQALGCISNGTCGGFSGSACIGCYSYGITAANAINFSGGSATSCIAKGGAYGYLSCIASDCVAYQCTTDGYHIGGYGISFSNCYAEGCGGYGFNITFNTIMINCAAFSNTSGNYSTSATSNNIGFVNLAASGLNSPSTGDYGPNATAGLRAAGYPTSWPTLSTSSYGDIGAAQHQDSGGSTTYMIEPYPMSSAGQLSAIASILAALSAGFGSSGVLTASGFITTMGTAQMLATGKLVSVNTVNMADAVAFMTTGELNASTSGVYSLSVQLASTGDIVANVLQQVQLTAKTDGIGTLVTGSAYLVEYGSVNVSSQGALNGTVSYQSQVPLLVIVPSLMVDDFITRIGVS